MNKQTLIRVGNDFATLNNIRADIKKIDPQKKTILFVEPYGSVISLLKHGAIKGFNIILISANRDLRQITKDVIQLAQLAIQIDTANEQNVMDLIQMLANHIRIDAVIPGFEYFVPLVARINHLLGLPGISPNVIANLRRKDCMRERLKNAGILIPNYHVVKSVADLNRAIERIGFPAICKPIDAAGSVNVRKVNNQEEAMAAALRIVEGNDVLWGHQLSKTMLYEEYIAGKEFSVEGVIQNENILYFSVTEKFVADQVEFIEVGHIVNPPINTALKKSIETYVKNVLTVLGANHCPFHVEIRINPAGQPVLMEAAARLAGDKIGDLINLTRNENYYDYLYAVYLAESILPLTTSFCRAGIRFFYRPELESYSMIKGIAEAKAYSVEEIKFYYNPHENIPSFPKPLRRVGHVMMKNHDHHTLVTTLDAVDKLIAFVPS